MPDYERPQASPQEVPPDLVECREALIACKQESEERLQALLRARADLDNHRKRAAREMENTRKYAVGRLLNVAARNHNPPGPQTSPFSGPH